MSETTEVVVTVNKNWVKSHRMMWCEFDTSLSPDEVLTEDGEREPCDPCFLVRATLGFRPEALHVEISDNDIWSEKGSVYARAVIPFGIPDHLSDDPRAPQLPNELAQRVACAASSVIARWAEGLLDQALRLQETSEYLTVEDDDVAKVGAGVWVKFWGVKAWLRLGERNHALLCATFSGDKLEVSLQTELAGGEDMVMWLETFDLEAPKEPYGDDLPEAKAFEMMKIAARAATNWAQDLIRVSQKLAQSQTFDTEDRF